MTEPRAKHQTIPSESSTALAEYVRQRLMEMEQNCDSSSDAEELADAFKASVLPHIREFADTNHVDGEYLTEAHVDAMLDDARDHLVNFVATIDQFDDKDEAIKFLVLAKDVLLKAVFGERHDTLTSRKDFLAAKQGEAQ